MPTTAGRGVRENDSPRKSSTLPSAVCVSVPKHAPKMAQVGVDAPQKPAIAAEMKVKAKVMPRSDITPLLALNRPPMTMNIVISFFFMPYFPFFFGCSSSS